MAIRVPPAYLSSHAYNSPIASKSKSNKTPSLHVAAVLKRQQQKERRGDSLLNSPLRTAEEIASRFGLDLAVAELERLFRRASILKGKPPPGGSGERRPLRVAYQGGRGSYTQEAAAAAFRPLSFEYVECADMEDAFSALEDRSVDRAVVPAENSVDGPIDRNLDLLLRHQHVEIIGELVIPVNHCLLSLPNARLSELRRVVSHPQALRHCEGHLEWLNLEIDEVDSTADAARFVAENRIADTAVIGSKMAADEFGLRVVESNFQDPGVNFNRFLQLGLASGSGSDYVPGPAGVQKTMVAFSLEKGVSDLFRAMWMFESRGVRVLRVEHRPNRANPIRVAEKRSGKTMYLDYVFVLELEGSGSDPKVKSAIAGLAEIAGFVRVLGRYTSKCE